MQQDNSSFWTDIKTFEERLANSPDSYCFARLSEVYLKVGLIEDALHTARQGVAKHPAYLTGQRALAMACHAKGLVDESIVALKKVTEAIPEDIAAQMLLGRLSSGAGDQDAARLAYRTVLEFAPENVECRIELESLDRAAMVESSFDSGAECDDEEIIEDLEILEELDVYEEEEAPGSEFQFEEAVAEPPAAPEAHHDPLSTSTLAELYVSQGFVHKALEIYRAILKDNPANSIVCSRVSELELLDVTAESPCLDDDEYCENDSEDQLESPTDTFVQPPVFQKTEAFFDSPGTASSLLPPKGIADNAINVLEGWLENIRRIKSCR